MMQMTTQEKIAVMQAHVDGKTIQVYSYSNGGWSESYDPRWNWTDFTYRIAPELIKIYIYRRKNGDTVIGKNLVRTLDLQLVKTIETEI